MPNSTKDQTCKISDYKVEGNKVTWKMACAAQGMSGEGEMLFTVSLKPGFGLGTTVCNDASIVFDFNPPIVTNEFCNTIGSPEDCENCIDDDGDTLVDRADPDCALPANGAGVGVGDAKVGKAVDKCGKTIRKVGAKLASNRLKQLGACEKAVADCALREGTF